MSEIVDKISIKLNELSELKEYVEKLEISAKRSKYPDIEFYEIETTEDDLEVSTRLFRIVKTFVKNNCKCDKCKNGLIKVKNDFFNEYNICECSMDKVTYTIEETPIYDILVRDDSVWYVSYDGKDKKMINSDMVLTEGHYTTRDYELGMYCTNFGAVEKIWQEMVGTTDGE